MRAAARARELDTIGSGPVETSAAAGHGLPHRHVEFVDCQAMNDPRPARPLNLDEVLQLTRRPRRWGCPILDIRPPRLARRGHLRGSAWLPVSDPSLLEQELPAHLLPSRGARIAVVSHEPREARYVAEYLERRGFLANWLEVGLAGIPFDPGPSLGALWTPDPYLMEQVSRLPRPEAGPVADLGAGNGRSAVFLASRGHALHCFDRLPDALELCQDRARRAKITVHTHQQILINGGILPGAPFASILMLRFVEKEMLAELGGYLEPGGVLLVHTYSAPTKNKGPDGGGPQKARYLLSPREVEELLPSGDWEFLHRSQIFESPGKAMIGFVARRRG